MSELDIEEDALRQVMALGAGMVRAGEVLLRAHQDKTMRAAGETVAETERLKAAAAARVAAAGTMYDHLATETWIQGASRADIRAAWEGLQGWAEVDPERFTKTAERFDQRIIVMFNKDPRDLFTEWQNQDAERGLRGTVYDQQRGLRAEQMLEAGVNAQVVQARTVADALNAQDPVDGLRSTGRTTAPKARGQNTAPGRSRGTELSR